MRKTKKMKKTKLYFHSNKESMLAVGEEIKLTETQLQEFIYTGYEVGVDVEIDNNGKAWATHFMGVKLERKVRV